MPIRNLFRKTVGGMEVQDENQSIFRGGVDRGFQHTPVAGSKPMDIKEPTEYKLSEINDSGVYLPPSPPEKPGFWHSRSNASTTSSNHRSIMNTVKSFWVGMAALTLAGGGAYYFAKREIDADRREKHLKRQAKQREEALLYGNHYGSQSPAQVAGGDPALTRHEPATDAQRVREKSKYEASEVYRSPKGDRFS